MGQMKNILIIGGSYFAGRIFVEELLKQKDCNIIVYNRGNLPLNKAGVIELVGDRNDRHRIRQTIPDLTWDAVVDFCAYTPAQIEFMLDSLPGALKHYIFISTTTVNQNAFDLPIKEDSPKLTGPQPELGQYADYGYNKWLAECRLNELCEQKGIACTSLRPAIIYGEYNYAPRETYFFGLIENDKKIILPDNGLPLYSFVYVVDLARVIIKALGNPVVFSQAFNIAAPELVSYQRMLEVFEEISAKKINTRKMSIEDINRKGIPLPFPLDNHLIYSGARIQNVLEFEYTSFVAGMRRAYEHYLLVQKHRQRPH
jgi:nucleoside-diphosphate-sugar epimerase